MRDVSVKEDADVSRNADAQQLQVQQGAAQPVDVERGDDWPRSYGVKLIESALNFVPQLGLIGCCYFYFYYGYAGSTPFVVATASIEGMMKKCVSYRDARPFVVTTSISTVMCACLWPKLSFAPVFLFAICLPNMTALVFFEAIEACRSKHFQCWHLSVIAQVSVLLTLCLYPLVACDETIFAHQK